MLSNIGYKIKALRIKAMRLYRYCSAGVWSDMRPLWYVKLIKTLNLSVKAFFNGDIQSKACALTYRSFLAFVPALALIFAIGKGFGLQDFIQQELIQSVPSQKQLLTQAFTFVDSYINTSSEGIFVGFGLALLLWTLISILGAVEDTFNNIWGIKNGRSIWRKITDYLAMFMVLPVLMICAGGMSAMVTTSVGNLLPAGLLTTGFNIVLDIASFVVVWLFFAAVYMMVPNTKVRFSNAFIAGIVAGTGFIILQWLFITGQVYVSKYNAVYGSFAFLPLFLIWMQLVWVVTLAGAVICYASQNIHRYNFSDEIDHISPLYEMKINVAVLAIVVNEYLNHHRSPTISQITNCNNLPNRLVSQAVNRLLDMGLLLRVVPDIKHEVYGYAPAVDPSSLTLGSVVSRYRTFGFSGFIPDFNERFALLCSSIDAASEQTYKSLGQVLIKDIKVDSQGDLSACDI